MQAEKRSDAKNGELPVEELIIKLKKIIAEELDVNLKIEDIAETEPLLETGLALDSIVLVEFITLIEQHFGIELSESDLQVESFKNLRVLAELIHSRRNNTAEPAQ